MTAKSKVRNLFPFGKTLYKALNDVTVHYLWMAEYKVLEFAALYMKVNLVTPEDKTEKCGQLKTNGNSFYMHWNKRQSWQHKTHLHKLLESRVVWSDQY